MSKKILIINGHQHYPVVAEGALTRSFIQVASNVLASKGYEVKHSVVEDYDVADELGKFEWADTVIFQFPSNWMGLAWKAKHYLDDVWNAGRGGVMCVSDGRSRHNPDAQYGTGGLFGDKSYMLSVTFNMPQNALDDPKQYLFAGKGLDDLLLPIHANFRYIGMQTLPTFASFDVLKNPTLSQDLEDFKQHIAKHI
ncbi:NAD(P)H-dependent oxidoreductase [Mannheimia haemolytica]|uniref:NAD(P)H-dependent oxidoreductase n=2 Tax=Mannheimia haemolytica TaxID=75985 RepID=UPI00201BDC30|nr:NAD(P)H-dependent oxidoreductase [Mannheimia haemolytica]UQX80026.1 NAD(P)H-dependent oxidoreductase [Mannheimia haemolytica]HDL1261974.1 NAD(P)H-dependent oxidoreductase [Mannheimia haemolytica]